MIFWKLYAYWPLRLISDTLKKPEEIQNQRKSLTKILNKGIISEKNQLSR